MLDIDHPRQSPDPPPTSITPPRSQGSQPPESSSGFRFAANQGPDIWRSPAFLKRTRISSGTFFDALHEPFAEDMNPSKRRKKVGRVSEQWTYTERSPSPGTVVMVGTSTSGEQLSEAIEFEARSAGTTELAVADLQSGPREPSADSRSPARTSSPATAHPDRSEGTHPPQPTALEDGTEQSIEPQSECKAHQGEMNVHKGLQTEIGADIPEGHVPTITSVSSVASELGPVSPVYTPTSFNPTIQSSVQAASGATDSSRAEEGAWETPVLPQPPRLRPLTSPNLPFMSPSIDRKDLWPSAPDEHYDPQDDTQVGEPNEVTVSQMVLEGVSESSPREEELSEFPKRDASAEPDPVDLEMVSPGLDREEQVLQRPESGGSGASSSPDTGRNNGSQNHSAFMLTERELANEGEGKSSRNTHSDKASSIGSVIERAFEGQEEWTGKDFEGLSTGEESLVGSVEDQSVALPQESEGDSSERDPGWEEDREDDSEDTEIHTQGFEYNRPDPNAVSEPLVLHDVEIIDLEDGSDDDALPHSESESMQVLENESENEPPPSADSSSVRMLDVGSGDESQQHSDFPVSQIVEDELENEPSQRSVSSSAQILENELEDELLQRSGSVSVQSLGDSEKEAQRHWESESMQRLEGESDDEDQQYSDDFSARLGEEELLSPASASSHVSQPCNSEDNYSTSDSVDDDKAPDSISYPSLFAEDVGESPPSHSPMATHSAKLQGGLLDQDVKTQLITPTATQQTDGQTDGPPEILYHEHPLPTPQLSQTAIADLLPPQISTPFEKISLAIHKSETAKSSSRRHRSSVLSNVPDVLSPWFSPKISSGVDQESSSGDESDAESEESEQSVEPTVDGFTDPEGTGNSLNAPHLPSHETATGETLQDGHSTTLSPRPILHQLSAPAGFRTPLSYFAPLATIQNHFGSTIDVLAIVTSTTPIRRSKTGPKDYHMTLHITDPSSNLSATSAQMFRPFKESLPIVQGGAVILLRNFKVQSQKHKLILVSTASSAWAVFEKGHDVQVSGPPVEMGAEERGFAKGLGQWWARVGHGVAEANGR